MCLLVVHPKQSVFVCPWSTVICLFVCETFNEQMNSPGGILKLNLDLDLLVNWDIFRKLSVLFSLFVCFPEILLNVYWYRII